MKDLKKQLMAYKRGYCLRPDESRVVETIRNAKFCFYKAAGERELHYFEFMYQQIHYIRKRWWGLQFLALVFTGYLIHEAEGAVQIQRLFSISSSLFVVLFLPELWKNRSANSLEIEETAYFPLRQIYAARMLAFAVVDGGFLGIFAGILSMTTAVTIGEIVIQFFLPMTVTCCICFRTLCSRYIASEYMACFLSLLWSAIWILFVLNDTVYHAVSVPLWFGICCMAILYLTYTVRRLTQKNDTGYDNGDAQLWQ